MRWTLVLLLVGCTSQPWIGPEELPSRRHGHRTERIGDALYLVGGSVGGGAVAQTWRFEDTWEPCAPPPEALTFFGSAVDEGALICVREKVWRYEPDRDHWEVLFDGGAPRSHFGTALVDGVLYTLGGYPEVDTGFHAFDLVARTRTVLPPPPGYVHGDHFHILVSLDGELHAIGGILEAGLSSAHWVWRDGAWVGLPDLPAEVWAKFAVWQVVDGQLVLFSTSENVGLRYDGAWHRLTPCPTWIAMATSTLSDGKLVVLGGMSQEEPRRLVYDLATDRWE